ncbi:MAG: RNA polymerase sigma factor [Evtepia gabavorous]
MDFEGIYQSYCKDVFRYLRSLSAGEDLAEEITQETFAKALKAIDRFQGDKDIRAWLFTIAKHTYYTHCKREKRTYGGRSPSIPGTGETLCSEQIYRPGAGLSESTRFPCTWGCGPSQGGVFTLQGVSELPLKKSALQSWENAQLGLVPKPLPGEETNHRIYGGD